MIKPTDEIKKAAAVAAKYGVNIYAPNSDEGNGDKPAALMRDVEAFKALPVDGNSRSDYCIACFPFRKAETGEDWYRVQKKTSQAEGLSMKLENFLSVMESGDETIISAYGRCKTQHILEIKCLADDDTGTKYFSANYFYNYYYDEIEVRRDDNNPLYGANTASEFLDKCRDLSLDEDVTALDWGVYKTRAELFYEIDALKFGIGWRNSSRDLRKGR